MGASLATIYLCGTFRIEDRNGDRVALQSSKSQALLALIATSPKSERSRTWLQSMLWSDRGPKQASGSMRQALTQLRKILGPRGIRLDVDRRRVALDLTTVRISSSGGGEFLEGIDVNDEAFESWLTSERTRRQNKALTEAPSIMSAPVSSEGWSLLIVPQATESNSSCWFNELFADSLARSLREVFVAPILVGQDAVLSHTQLVLKVNSFASKSGSTAIRIVVEHPATRSRVWSAFRELPSDGVPPIDHPDIQQMISELIDTLGDHLIYSSLNDANPNSPDRLFRLAIRSLFTMEAKRVLEADRLLEEAQQLEDRGLYYAWRMQLRAIQLIEKHPIDEEATRDEGKEFFRRALDREPNNSMVLALLANSLRRFDRNDSHSLFLAERSARINPANSFAWWALSAANSYVGDAKSAYRNARFGRRIAILSQHRFWWDNQVFTSALLQGRISEALKFAEAAHSGNPDFRPPLRYLIALHASEGNFKEALTAAAKLRSLEPDFTVERLLKDQTYPASLIHTAPNLNKERMAALL